MDNKSEVKKWSLIISLVFIFSFFSGYYICYRTNEKNRGKLEIIQDIMANEWYYGIDEENIEEVLETNMILGMMNSSKDPYTRYLTSLGSLADSFTGIGIEVNVYGEYFIISEVNGYHAYIDGLREGDLIISVNDVSVKDKSLTELNELILKNKNVALKLKRIDSEIVINTTVETYNPLTVFTREYGNVAYAKISEFNLDTSEYLRKYFNTLNENCDNLILDLRGNPGGYISAVKEVLDLFVTKDKVVMSTIDKKGNAKVIKTVDDGLYFFDNIYVLIDENSASGAEALAAALNYHLDERVTLYGNTTYGKGSAQKTINFSDGTYFHYTYALWNTPYGNTINGVGVEPEIKTINKGISSLKLHNKELKLYDYGDEVLNIQKFLKILDYYKGDRHSFMDNETIIALKEFQEDYNLVISGEVDLETLRIMQKLIYDDKIEYLDNELKDVLGRINNE